MGIFCFPARWFPVGPVVGTEVPPPESGRHGSRFAGRDEDSSLV
ncbi:hypothetical protein A2U01_0081631, partial [Trifolium medium]|nr:hypothetical protein [Trifolium medium]